MTTSPHFDDHDAWLLKVEERKMSTRKWFETRKKARMMQRYLLFGEAEDYEAQCLALVQEYIKAGAGMGHMLKTDQAQDPPPLRFLAFRSLSPTRGILGANFPQLALARSVVDLLCPQDEDGMFTGETSLPELYRGNSMLCERAILAYSADPDWKAALGRDMREKRLPTNAFLLGMLVILRFPEWVSDITPLLADGVEGVLFGL